MCLSEKIMNVNFEKESLLKMKLEESYVGFARSKQQFYSPFYYIFIFFHYQIQHSLNSLHNKSFQKFR